MSEIKNVILISDQGGACIDSLLSTKQFHIKMLLVPYKKNVDDLKFKYGDTIENYVYIIPDTNEEFQDLYESDYNLTYDDIEMYRGTQLKCYRYNTRFIIDDNTNNYIYYTALRYFLGFFKKNKIDCVISRLVEHGSFSDSLLFDIAKNSNIPVYLFSLSSAFGSTILYSLFDYKNKRFVDLSLIDKNTPNISEYLKVLDKNYSSNKVMTLPFSKLISKFFSKKNKTFVDCVKWLYMYRLKYYFNSFKKNSLPDLFKIREETSFWQMVSGHRYLKKLLKLYKDKSLNIQEGENYILFPLHMEPEASTMVRATLSCQLYLIELISKALPDGWYLYVKEHPDQFYKVQLEKHLHKSILNFRNIDFYKRVSKIKNVRLINVSVPSSELISKSRAVTSISGSSLIESVAKKKPVLVWGNGCTFVELLNESYKIRCLSDLDLAISQIKNGCKPQYSDFGEVINSFVFSIEYRDFYETNATIANIFRMIYNKID